ncbi:MAG: hypothetical protein EOO73_09340 [Myxococcales bacterium]|nr:MAG: hypothetical protein EOO73_09340 [Myxococcales bacterium]
MAFLAKPKNALLLLLAAYCVARYRVALIFDNPVFGWRPTDMASIALNYARGSMSFLHPQVSWGGSGPGYVEMEFPLVPYLTAILFKLFGFHEGLSLVVPLLSGFLLVWFTYLIGRRWFGALEGLCAGLLVAVVPPFVMLTVTGMWADPPSVLATTAGLYYAYEWSESGRHRSLIAAAALLSLGALLKLTALHVGLPVAYLLWRRLRGDVLKAPQTWLLGLGILLPNVAWYYYSYRVGVESGNTFGILAGGTMKFGSKSLYEDPAFYLNALRRIALYHLTPVGTFGFVYGMRRLIAEPAPRNLFLLSWLASVLVYSGVAAHGVHGGHYHYLLPFLPVAALVVGVGGAWLLRAAGPWLTRFAQRLGAPAAALSALFVVGTAANVAWSTDRFFRRDRHIDSTMWQQKKVTGMLVKKLTRPGALIIVVDVQNRVKEKSMSPPDVFYFGDRKGWYEAVHWLTWESIESLRGQGAEYLIVSGQSVEDFREHQPRVYESLKQTYTSVLDDETGIVFDLRGHGGGKT